MSFARARVQSALQDNLRRRTSLIRGWPPLPSGFQGPLGNPFFRSSVALGCDEGLTRCVVKRSFGKVRSQAELGNEEKRGGTTGARRAGMRNFKTCVLGQTWERQHPGDGGWPATDAATACVARRTA
jgi:hypothetical protein